MEKKLYCEGLNFLFVNQLNSLNIFRNNKAEQYQGTYKNALWLKVFDICHATRIKFWSSNELY